jgi:hypothetical protein
MSMTLLAPRQTPGCAIHLRIIKRFRPRADEWGRSALRRLAGSE